MNWNEYFIKMCNLVASKSEDTSTKCGAVIVGSGNEVISTGYNGFPRRVKNTPERNERPIKYSYFEHSERNAIYNAARIGAKTEGATIYVTGYPCCDCARAIIQSGIRHVIIPMNRNQEEFEKRWRENINTALIMFREAGVTFWFSDDNGKTFLFID